MKSNLVLNCDIPYYHTIRISFRKIVYSIYYITNINLVNQNKTIQK